LDVVATGPDARTIAYKMMQEAEQAARARFCEEPGGLGHLQVKRDLCTRLDKDRLF
jgi:hypothetical protein